MFRSTMESTIMFYGFVFVVDYRKSILPSNWNLNWNYNFMKQNLKELNYNLNLNPSFDKNEI